MRIEKFSLEDGRQAERHIRIDADGNETVDIYTEPLRPLNHDQRIIYKRKEVVSEQRIQRIVDGQVVEEEVFSIEPEIQRVRQDPITKDELATVVAEGVVSAMRSMPTPEKPPGLSIQSVMEQRNEEKETTSVLTYAMYGLAIVAQLVLLGGLYFYL